MARIARVGSSGYSILFYEPPSLYAIPSGVFFRFTRWDFFCRDRVNAGILDAMGKLCNAPAAPAPTYREVCDLALRLARESGAENELLFLIDYPVSASPPPEPWCFFMGWAARVRTLAAAILSERLAGEHRRHLKWLRRRPRPRREWVWTRHPLANPHPSPRRRGYLPLWRHPDTPPPRQDGLRPLWPCSGAPPPRLIATRPGGGEPFTGDLRLPRKHRFRFEVLLDNRIAG